MNRKRVIIGSVCVILLVALIGGTFAWFYINEEVTVSYGNSIFCEAGDSLEIALVGENGPGRFSSSIDYSADDFTIVDISGDGYNLYRPTEIDEDQQPVGLVNLRDTNTYDYVELEVAFRSVSKMNVYLSEESFIVPVNTEISSERPNIYGDFSKDYIAGAMRVAVIDGEEVKMLWAPNSSYHLIPSTDNEGNLTGRFTFNPNSTPESAYYYYAEENGEPTLHEVSADEYASKRFVVDSTGAKKGWSGNSPVLVSLNPASEGVHDQKTVKIRIWFEGTDREAHQALAGGNVKIQLKFIGVAKEISEENQLAIDSITFDPDSAAFTGLTAGMVFSTDGRTWTDRLPNLQSGASVFVKYPETETHYETTCRKFTKN